MNQSHPLFIRFLNHSSVLLESAEHRLVVDPWLTGTAFTGGWALEWNNPAALDVAARADAVWVSHPHSDHLHFETLQALCARNPNLVMLANTNSQIDMAAIVKSLPFREIVRVPERQLVEVAPHTRVFVVPSLAIDAILAYQSHDLFVLNVNDAILDPHTTRAVLQRSPAFRDRRPDVLLINFSHANRIPEAKADKLSQYFKDRLRDYIAVFRPRACLPIASFQLYTGEFARWQNEVRVRPSDLRDIDPCVQDFLPGYTAEVTPHEIRVHTHAVQPQPLAHRTYPERPSLDALRRAVSDYSTRLRRELYGVALPRPLRVRFTDFEAVFELDFARGSLTQQTDSSWQLECYAKPFHSMLTKPYGFDAFYVNADYRVAASQAAEKRVSDFIFKGCLVDYQLTPRAVMNSVLVRDQWRYLRNRREQLLHIVSRGHVFGGVR
ncbi:MAG: MBL fold metallo-hydrolase [Polyangiales bacterium]